MAFGIGLIGAGGNQKLRHIPGFREINDVEIVNVVNRSRESGERVAAEWDIPRVSESVEELLADPAVDAVSIGTWPYMHLDYTPGSARSRQARALRGAHGHERDRGRGDARNQPSASRSGVATRSRSIRLPSGQDDQTALRGRLAGQHSGSTPDVAQRIGSGRLGTIALATPKRLFRT